MTLTNNALVDKAETIRTLVAESAAALQTSTEKALEAGQRLVEAKAECKHGEWLPFLERVDVPERKAQRYMKLAQSGLKSDTVTDLGGIRGALEFLAKREAAAKAFDAALADYVRGGFGIEHLDAAIAIMDDMIELFPEEQRGALQRHQPEEDAAIVAARIADIVESA